MKKLAITPADVGFVGNGASGDLEQLYADLAWTQRGSYAAYLDLGRYVVASASPELFFDWTAERLRTRPMKGTARRGATTAEDAERCARLVGSEKERAENLMIVDLLRNDLGLVSQIGSVHVPKLMDVESYETVHQLVSTIRGRLRDDVDAVDAIRATFPGGSMTGALQMIGVVHGTMIGTMQTNGVVHGTTVGGSLQMIGVVHGSTVGGSFSSERRYQSPSFGSVLPPLNRKYS